MCRPIFVVWHYCTGSWGSTYLHWLGFKTKNYSRLKLVQFETMYCDGDIDKSPLLSNTNAYSSSYTTFMITYPRSHKMTSTALSFHKGNAPFNLVYFIQCKKKFTKYGIYKQSNYRSLIINSTFHFLHLYKGVLLKSVFDCMFYL